MSPNSSRDERIKPNERNLLELYRAHRDEIDVLTDPTALFILGLANHVGRTGLNELAADLGLSTAALQERLTPLLHGKFLIEDKGMLGITTLGRRLLSEIGFAPPPPPPSGGCLKGFFVSGLIILSGLILLSVFLGVINVSTPRPAATPRTTPTATSTFTPTPTNTPTPTPTNTFTPTPTRTPTPTPTNTPTNTPTPTPTPTKTPVILLNFIREAPKATWISGAGTLPFGGADSDPRGFALWRQGHIMEDGSKPDLALETHPQWIQEGYIGGNYPQLLQIQSGDRLHIKVGFLNGAGAGEVTFFVVFSYPGCGEFYCMDTLMAITHAYENRLIERVIDLSQHAGRRGTYSLRVSAGQSSAQDWATWVIAQIERP